MKSTRILAALLLSLIAIPHSRSEPESDGPNTLYNPNPAPCCSCIALTVAGVVDQAEAQIKRLKPDENGDYRAEVIPSYADNAPPNTTCADSYEVTVTATLLSQSGRILTESKSTTVNKNQPPNALIFDLTAEQARLGDQWKFDLTCGGNGNEGQPPTAPDLFDSKPGCASITINLGGCDSCSSDSCAYTGDVSSSSSSFTVSIPTTRSFGGMTEGTLDFYAKEFANPGRAALLANMPSSFVVNRAAGIITSVDTGAATLEVAPAAPALLALDPNAFTVTHKDLTGTTFRTTTISLVTEAGITRFRMDSEFDNTITRHEQTQPAAGTLVLEKGRLVSGAFQPLWQETLVKTGATPGIRVHRRTIKDRPTATASWSVSSDVETTWENQSPGWVLTKEIIDPGPTGAKLTSTWSYYQPGEITGSGGSTEGLGRIKSHLRHDGYQSFQTYSLHQATVATPFLGDPGGNVRTSTWNPVTKTETTTTALNGIIVGKTITAHTPTTLTRTVHTAANDVLTTTTHYVESGQIFGGKPTRILHPDNTLTTHSYEPTAEGGIQTTTDHGATTDNINVSMGTRTITTTNSRGTTILREVTAIGYGTGTTVFERTAVTEVDNLGRALTTAHFPTAATVTGEQATATGAKWTTSVVYSCCGIAKETNQFGVPTYHAYDHLQRRIKSNTLGVTTEIVRLGLTTETHRYPDPVTVSLNPTFNGNEDTLIARSSNNLSGTEQKTWSPDPTPDTRTDPINDPPRPLILNSTTLTEFAPEATLSRRTTTTVQGGHSQITDTYLDGRPYKTSGALSPAVQYDYVPNATGLLSLQAYLVGDDYYEATATLSDWAGRTTHSGAATPGTGSADDLGNCALGPVTNYLYNSLGQLKKTIDPDDVTTLHAYNTRGERTTTAVKLDAEETITYGIDQVTFSETVPALDGTDPIWVTTNKVWYNDETDQLIESTVSTTTRTPDGLFSSTQTIGIGNPSTAATVLQGNGNWTTTSTNPDGTYSVTTYTDGLMDIIENFDSDEDLISSISIRDATNDPLSGYDGLKRPIHQRDSRTGVTTTVYLSDTADFVAQVEDPSTPPRITSFTYDTRGRRTHVDAPDTPNPAGGTHDNITITAYNPDSTILSVTGDQTYPVSYTYDYADRMKTMLTSGAQSATTTWKYTEDRGFLWRKEYQGGKGTSYTHTAAGRLKTRTWQRGVLTTYDYDSAGRLETVSYSDATPGTTISLDALGRSKAISNGIATSVFKYDPTTLAIDTETVTYDFPGSDELVRVINHTALDLGRPTGWQVLDEDEEIEHQTEYRYHATDGRLHQVESTAGTFTYGYEPNSHHLLTTITGPVHSVTNTWETHRDVLATKTNAVTIGTVHTPSAFQYTVNAIGQRSALRPLLDENDDPIATYTPSWDWAYNSRGELVAAEDKLATNHRAYQFDAIGNRQKSIAGLYASLASAPVNYTANALNQYTQAAGITLPIAPTPAPYDLDGNLRFDGGVNKDTESREYLWDAENRLIAVKRTSDSVTLVTYHYDANSRLISRTAGVSPSATTTRYLYDGWNRIAEYQETGTGHLLKTSYLWGMDISGSMQGAGGVAGLLLITDHTALGTPSYYPTYDGNGNVTEYLDEDGIVVAHYEYDPFGNNITPTADKGSLHDSFAYRFSTKPVDSVTGWFYYGYRWYDATTGRWPSRDPIEEQGGVNLHGFVSNDGLNDSDLLGLDTVADPEAAHDAVHKAAVSALADAEKEYLDLIMSDNPEVVIAGIRDNRPYKPTKPREYGGMVCESCIMDEKGVKHYTYYVTLQKAAVWPYSARASILLHPSVTPKCEDGDKHIAYWHTHPSQLQHPSVQLRKAQNLNETTYYWSSADSFSGSNGRGGDHGTVTSSGKPLYVTRRNSPSAYQWKITTSILAVGARQGSQVRETDNFEPQWVDLKGAKP